MDTRWRQESDLRQMIVDLLGSEGKKGGHSYASYHVPLSLNLQVGSTHIQNQFQMLDKIHKKCSDARKLSRSDLVSENAARGV